MAVMTARRHEVPGLARGGPGESFRPCERPDARERPGRRRADPAGEQPIGAALARLARAGWRVLAAHTAAGGAGADHVLVGPGGVFTLSTRIHHPGARLVVGARTVSIGGHPTPYLRDARLEAERASRLLSRAARQDVECRAALVLAAGSLSRGTRFAGRPRSGGGAHPGSGRARPA
jgi:hypothetical protein